MRHFPDPSNDTLAAFAFHSTRIERIPLRFEDIQATVSGQNINPYLSGQLSAINLVLFLAPNDKLIPETAPPSWRASLQQLQLLKDLHRNIMTPVSEHGLSTLDETVLPLRLVGEYRDERKYLAGREMPNPISIPNHLHDLWSDLITFHNQYRAKIESFQNLNNEDIAALVQKAYESNLKICCIKPFTDGSNRVARLFENLIRLNFGLPWKIIRHEDQFKLPYIDDIIKMQKLFPA